MNGLPWMARIYIVVMLLLGALLLFWSLSSLPQSDGEWLTLLALTVAGAVAQLFPVLTPRNQAYHVTLVFIFAGVLTLPAGALALLVVVVFIPEWIKAGRRWYIQLFNMSNFLVDALLAREVFAMVAADGGRTLVEPRSLLGALLAAAVFTFVNHLLLAVALRLARGHSWRDSRLFEVENLLIDGGLSCVGAITVLLWQTSPLLVSLIAAPLYLTFKALKTPSLQEEARTDPKTGLYNARHFSQVLDAEFHRAARFGRPLSVIMADMDLLREINNTYGHLAGDAALKGVAEIISRGLREYDVPARFGGEEFAVLLTETDSPEALVVAERLRKRVEEALFTVPTSGHPIRATISMGIASFPAHGGDPDEVMHQADLAVYYAKLQGRNRVWIASPESSGVGFAMAHHWDVELPRAVPSPAQRAETEGSSVEPVGAQDEREQVPGEADAGGPTADEEAAAPALGRKGGYRRWLGADQLTWQLAFLTGEILVGYLILLVGFRPWQAELDWLALGALAVLTVAAQSVGAEIYGRNGVSTSAIVVLAGAILFGLPGALLLAPMVAAIAWISCRGPLCRGLCDLGNTALSGAAAALAYQGLAARSPDSIPFLLLAAGMAGLVYYVVNVALLSVTMGLYERRSSVVIWKERFRWLSPHYFAFGCLALAVAVAYQALGLYGFAVLFAPPVVLRYVMRQYLDRALEHAAGLERINKDLVQVHDKTVHTLQEMQNTYDATIVALSTAIDSRDTERPGHARRVVQYVELIAREMGLSEGDIKGLLNGARLHDVGKIVLPDAILLKPAPLTLAEWAAVRKHPEQGYGMLRHIGFLNDALTIIRYHHERWDGRGYPYGLKGEQIPRSARIFAVADTFDAMTSDRPYRSARSVQTARNEIARCEGTQFEPSVVQAFLRIDAGNLARICGQPLVPEDLQAAQGGGERRSRVGGMPSVG